MPTLFEPFTQAHSKRAGGSGLGLAVCARLTDLMAGTLSVESEVGVGSAFTVDLPLEPTTAPELPTRPRVGPRETANGFWLLKTAR